ncbi:MAG: hypothetical protein QGG48_00220 [Desulfatiglandales bacterium]|jgi:DNA-binding response OmpR family regulator|nr:hypothetical protein [Desulfatiglandales bacterium]
MDRVLVIDDEGAILKILDKVLTHLGYRVKVAQDGEKRLELFNFFLIKPFKLKFFIDGINSLTPNH